LYGREEVPLAEFLECTENVLSRLRIQGCGGRATKYIEALSKSHCVDQFADVVGLTEPK
jgi:hypothetical protein